MGHGVKLVHSLPRGEWYIYCLCLTPYLGAVTYAAVELTLGLALLWWPILSVISSLVADAIMQEHAQRPREGQLGERRFDS